MGQGSQRLACLWVKAQCVGRDLILPRTIGHRLNITSKAVRFQYELKQQSAFGWDFASASFIVRDHFFRAAYNFGELGLRQPQLVSNFAHAIADHRAPI